MRRLAIGSLLLSLLAMYMLQWGAFGRSAPAGTAPSNLRLEVAFIVFAPAIAGLALGLVVICAPYFGRKREGVGYALFAVALSAIALVLVLLQLNSAYYH